MTLPRVQPLPLAPLFAQVNEFHDKAANADLDNARLRGEIATLRQSLEVQLSDLPPVHRTKSPATHFMAHV